MTSFLIIIVLVVGYFWVRRRIEKSVTDDVTRRNRKQLGLWLLGLILMFWVMTFWIAQSVPR